MNQDLPGLLEGETYRYRIAAGNDSSDPVVHGSEQTLTVPATAAVESDEPCPNQALRSGPSAALPDCRGYEQLTPVDKQGAKEYTEYEALHVESDAVVGEDGEHFMVSAPAVDWLLGQSAGGSPYFFARSGGGWQMTAGSPQPETGLDTYRPQIASPDLTSFGFEATYASGSPAGESKNVEYRVGAPGGPYTTVASVPRSEVPEYGGWVANSHDFSKLILEVEDHRLVEPKTTTTSGNDLYEYSGVLCARSTSASVAVARGSFTATKKTAKVPKAPGWKNRAACALQ